MYIVYLDSLFLILIVNELIYLYTNKKIYFVFLCNLTFIIITKYMHYLYI